MSEEQPVANFVRVIFEGPLPMRAHFECLHCDEPLLVDRSRGGLGCPDCGTFTPASSLAEHLRQCVESLKGS